MLGGQFVTVLASAKGGDASSFDVLWRDVNPALLRYLRVMAGDDAERAAVRTWVDAARGLADFRGDETAWRARVFGIARRHAFSDSGAPQSLPFEDVASSSAFGDELKIAEGPVAVRACTTLQDVVTSVALDLVVTLPDLQAEVLLLLVVGGLSTDDTAHLLQRSPRTVRTAARQAAAAVASAAAERERAGAATTVTSNIGQPRRPVGKREREAALDAVLAGNAVPADASLEAVMLSHVVAALTAPATPAELAAARPAQAAYRRFVLSPAPAPRPVVPPRRERVGAGAFFGSRVAAAAAMLAFGLGGATIAAYAGVLPDALQDVAHTLIHAPAVSSGHPAPGPAVPRQNVPGPPGGTTPSHTGNDARHASHTPGATSGGITGSSQTSSPSGAPTTDAAPSTDAPSASPTPSGAPSPKPDPSHAHTGRPSTPPSHTHPTPPPKSSPPGGKPTKVNPNPRPSKTK